MAGTMSGFSYPFQKDLMHKESGLFDVLTLMG